MNISYASVLSTIVVIVITLQLSFTHIHPEIGSVQVKEEAGPGGVWRSKVQWKAHWVKHWETRKIWVPIWRKIWGPVEIKEWMPLPKPPPPQSWAPPQHH